MPSILKLILGVPLWAYLAATLVCIYLAEFGLQPDAAQDAPEGFGGRDFYPLALIFGILAMARLLWARSHDSDDETEMMRRVDEAARLARDYPPPQGVEAEPGEPAPPQAAYRDDSPLGRLRAARSEPGEGGS